MSKRKSKPVEGRPATPDAMRAAVRKATGRPGWSFGKDDRPRRRLRCDRCKKTWKFSDALNFSPCPGCKAGRLS